MNNIKTKKIIKIIAIVLVIFAILTTAIYYTCYGIYNKQFKDHLNAIENHLTEVNGSDLHFDNVILLIGDGMGFNQLEATKAIFNIDTLFMETLPTQSQSQTRSLANDVTDSAAGATALSCGYRTYNRQISQRTNVKLKTITEIAQEKQMLTGVITTDDPYGATPGAFSSHANDRSNYKEITLEQSTSKINYLVGSVVAGNIASEYEEKFVNNNYNFITDFSNLPSKNNGNYYGVLEDLHSSYNYDKSIKLEDVTKNALNYLENDNGFFLMVEGARIDKYNHKNDINGMVNELVDFDNTVKCCLDYAIEKQNTLVIVTADHESGGLTLTNGEFEYTTDGHTGVNVPLFVYGLNLTYDAYMNTDIFGMMNWAIR